MLEKTATAALSRAAQALFDSARTHKRSEAHHRRRARDLMKQLDELRRTAAAHGIDFEIDTGSGRGQSHG